MSTTNDDRKQETSDTALVRIEETADGPRLYTGDVRPGGRVVLMAESSVGEYVSVTFAEGGQPLVGVGDSFLLGSGASVEFAVAQVPDGHYAFTVEASNTTLLEARLAVSSEGSLEKTGFVIRAGRGASGSALLLFRRASIESSIDLEVEDRLEGTRPEVSIRETGKLPEVLETANRSIPVAGVGCVATVYLGSRGGDERPAPPSAGYGRGKGQTGGTEQVEIVIDPDGGGG